MSPPEVWGPPIWTLFHVLAEKINEHAYPFFMSQLFQVIKMICSALPCPECTQDATIFLSKIKLQDLKTKNDFKNMIYIFHNHVNVKKRKHLYNYSNLEIYKKYNIIHVFNRFISVYHTRGNMNLLAESFRRQLIVKNVKNWFSNNIRIFAPSQPVNNTSEPAVESIGEDENIVIVESLVEEVKQEEVHAVEPVVEEVKQEEVHAVEAVVEEVKQEEVHAVEPVVEPVVEPLVEPTVVTSKESEVLETTEQQKTKKGRKKKAA
jgi:hypothetical protein